MAGDRTSSIFNLEDSRYSRYQRTTESFEQQSDMAFGERLRAAGRMQIPVKDRHALRGRGRCL